MPYIKLKVYGQTVLLDGGGAWPEWGAWPDWPPWIRQRVHHGVEPHLR